MAIGLGTRVGVYEITSLLGAGGMGEVYRARDTRLQRDVALKVLPEVFAADRDRLARFQREAQILASLNHPNIAQIYGIEESSPARCLVMELVAGETLHQRIQRGPLPLAQALAIATQIATALETAHERGIVHRDLKPANVKVLPDGTAKVLDFGIAKIATRGGFSGDTPTLGSNAETNAGMIIGTVGYMSPEQARGESVDHRTDIFAFGCVLYEMLSGKQAFQRKTVSDTLAAILTSEPDATPLPTDLPIRLRRLLTRCLTKDLRDRWQAIGDVRFELEHLTEESASVSSVGGSRAAWILAAAATLALAALTWIHFRGSGAALPEMRLEIATPSTPAPFEFAMSPDGKNIAFVASGNGAQRIWLRALDKTEAQPLPGTEGGGCPFWSPDSQSIAFYAGGKLKRIDIAGGTPQILASSSAAFGGAWNAQGDIVFTTSSGPLSHMKASGGAFSAITHIDPPDQVQHRYPQFLPDGRHFLFYSYGTTEKTGIYVGSLDRGTVNFLTVADSAGGFLPPDMVVYERGTSMLVQHLDLKTLTLKGEPARLGGGFMPSSFGGLGGPSISGSGSIVYREGGDAPRRLKWFERSGKDAGFAGEPDFSLTLYPELSPDGQQVAMARSPTINSDIWVMELLHGTLRRLTFDPAVELAPVWSADGRIAYASTKKGDYNIYAKPANGAGAEEALLEGPNSKYTQDWSKDGKFLLYSSLDSKRLRSLWALPMTGTDRKPIAVSGGAFDNYNGQFSPDGHWVAYQSAESGDFQIVVQPFPDATGKWQVSMAGGSQPRWRADGKELYFLAPDGKLMAASVTTDGSTFAAGTPVALFQTSPVIGAGLNRQQYAVSHDGRFLVNQPAESAVTAPIRVILNWRHP